MYLEVDSIFLEKTIKMIIEHIFNACVDLRYELARLIGLTY